MARKKITKTKTDSVSSMANEFYKAREKLTAEYATKMNKKLRERKAKLEAGLETTEHEPFEFFTPPAPTTEGETETETETAEKTASSEEIEDTKEVLVPPVIPEEPTETKDDDIPDSA